MRLGIVGTGAIVKEVLPQLSRWGWKAAALCGTSRSRDAVRTLCRENQIEEAYFDYAAMLAEARIDTVYIGAPNFLHYHFAMQALEAGRHVIVEKPMTSNCREAEELAALAKKRGLCLFEAVTTVYQPNFAVIKGLLSRIGRIRVVSCNYSQYSRRYDDFREGRVLPAFDPEKSGGALMDLNLYNLHYLLGLFGEPRDIKYHANVERGIDTSGILTLDYGDFQAVSIAAKDCAAPKNYVIQGTEGYILQDTSANLCGAVTLHLNDGTEELYDENPSSRLEAEFLSFARQIASGDRTACYQMLEHSLKVSRSLTQARLSAGIRFPSDAFMDEKKGIRH